jgi:hypothetical protein
MSQRRGGTHKEPVVAVEEETMTVPFGESLDLPASGLTMERNVPEPITASAPTNAPVASGSLSLDARYESENQALKLKQWKEGHFASGMSPSTWGEEYQKWRYNFRAQCTDFSHDDGNPCMAILRQSTEWVEQEEEDESGEMKPTRFTRPRLDFVAGPVSRYQTIVSSGLDGTYYIIGSFGLTFLSLLNHVICLL